MATDPKSQPQPAKNDPAPADRGNSNRDQNKPDNKPAAPQK